MKTGTGIGIAALIIAVVGMFLPVIGLFVSWIALIIACFAALFGDRGLTIATVIVSVVGFIIFTPSLWATITVNGVATSPSNVLRLITLILVVAPIVCIILNATGRLMLGRPKTAA